MTAVRRPWLPGRGTVALALLAAAPALLAPAPARAQATCSWVDPTRSAQSFTIPGQGQIWYLGGPSIRCTDGVRIQADSAVVYPAQNMTHLMGRVRFRDATKELTSDEARYFSRQGRMQATGRTLLRDTVQGSEIRHGDVVLLRRNELRDQDQITVTTGLDQVRPTARLQMVSGEGKAPQSPYLVEGDRIFLQGNQYFLATGFVAIQRDSLLVFADTAEYDEVASRMLLRGDARVEGGTYDLSGRTVTIILQEGEMTSLRASRDAVLTGEELRVRAPLIQIMLEEGRMDRLVATPLPGDPTVPLPAGDDAPERARPVAEAEGFRLTADSVDALAPGERLERIVAVGRARGETSTRDSLNVPDLPEVARTDWLEGDTLVATFVRVEEDPDLPRDTAAAQYRLEQIHAKGSARSLYRFAPSDSAARPGIDPPAVHYATGSSILITFVEGEVDRMLVDGPTRGWHLEPTLRRAGSDTIPPPDSASAPHGSGRTAPPRGTTPPPGASGPGQIPPRGEGEGALAQEAPAQRGRRQRSHR